MFNKGASNLAPRRLRPNGAPSTAPHPLSSALHTLAHPPSASAAASYTSCNHHALTPSNNCTMLRAIPAYGAWAAALSREGTSAWATLPRRFTSVTCTATPSARRITAWSMQHGIQAAASHMWLKPAPTSVAWAVPLPSMRGATRPLRPATALDMGTRAFSPELGPRGLQPMAPTATLFSKASTGSSTRDPLILAVHALHTSVSTAGAAAAGAHTAAPASSSAPAVGSAPTADPTAPQSVQVVDYTTLAACCAEIKRAWVPAKVEQVVMGGRTDLSIKLRTIQGGGWLHISWHPVGARVCASTRPPMRGTSAEAFTLGDQIQDNLAGLVLLDAVMPQAWERVLQLQFGERPGDPPTRSLYCEVLTRYSNLILAGPGGSILACAAQVGTSKSSLRQLQTGGVYQLPPITSGVPPDSCAGLSEWRDTVTRAAAMAAASQAMALAAKQQKKSKGGVGQYAAMGMPSVQGGQAQAADTAFDSAGSDTATDLGASTAAASHMPPSEVLNGSAGGPGTLLDGLTRAFHGVSPPLVEELCRAAGPDGPAVLTPPPLMSDAQWEALHGHWMAWLGRCASGAWAATSDPETGRYSVLGTYAQQYGSVFDLLDVYYSEMQGGEVHAQLHHRLSTALAVAVKKAGGRVRAFEKQLLESEGADAVQLHGDMITANIWRIPPGATQVEVESWETGESMMLQLDADKGGPVKVAEGMYKRARKLRRAVQAVQPLLEASQLEVQYLAEIESSLLELRQYKEEADLKALSQVHDELVQQGYLKPPPDAALAAKGAAKAKKGAAKAAKRAGGGGAAGQTGQSGFRIYTSPGGYQVLVGRNNIQNDELSNVVAKAGDVWMHVRGMPGSHAVIKVPSGKTPGEPDLQFCANLAAFYSRAKDNGKADVIVCLAQHLKKPRGAKPGQVMVTKELRNIVARPAESAGAKEGSN